MNRPPARAPRRHDAERARADILAAALVEFSEHGHGGARIDRIAERSGMSKPMLYSYFGDKEELYAAALREAYIQIRAAEAQLNLADLAPEAAIARLMDFTLDHFIEKPWFISMLNTENLRRGSTIAGIADLEEIQSQLLGQLRDVLARGAAAGTFRSDVEATDVYVTIASLCWFPVSNRYTLRAVFHRDIEDAAWLAERRRDVTAMVLGFLAVPDA